MGSILVFRCVQNALLRSCDYRDGFNATDWAKVRSEVTLTAEDLKLVWFLIGKEVCYIRSRTAMCVYIMCVTWCSLKGRVWKRWSWNFVSSQHSLWSTLTERNIG